MRESQAIGLPADYRVFEDVNASGSCLFDSWAVHLQIDENVRVDHRLIRETANEFICNHWESPPSCAGTSLLFAEIEEARPTISLDDKAAFIEKKWIKESKFQKDGYRAYYNRPEVQGDRLHMVSLALLIGCQVDIYSFRPTGGYFIRSIVPHEWEGKVYRFLYHNAHYEPIIKTVIGKSRN